MRTIILFAVFFAGPLAFAESGSPALVVIRKTHYSVEQSVLKKEKGQWLCQTELKKRNPIDGIPKSLAAFQSLKPSESLRGEPCRDPIKVSREKAAELDGCATNAEWKNAMEILARECGRL
ncbi:MAG: hypothetical protein ACXWQO_05930 [Bdellovibrionota bacterium]